MLKALEKYINTENIDAKLRYLPVVKEIKQLNAENSPVLEVGSGINGISDYYAGEVIGIDKDFSKTAAIKNENIMHKKGLVTNIPFLDNSFEYVVCSDTLEHLPDKSREVAVGELIRVTKVGGVLFLGFPQGDLSGFVEGILRKIYFFTHQTNHPWLAEHLQYQLPNTSAVDQYLKKLHVKSIRKTGNVNLFAWFLIHLFFTVCNKGRLSRIMMIFKLPLEVIGRINLPPFYRSLLMVRK